MPRILPDGPSLQASSDGRWVALAQNEEVSLYDALSGHEVKRIALPVPGTTEVAFTTAGPTRIVTATQGEGLTALHSFTVPHLDPIARRDFPGAWTTLATVGERMLLKGGAEGEPEEYQIAVLTPKLIVADSVTLRAGVRFAALAPEDRLLIDARTALEFWDAHSRRALFRLTLPLPPAPMQVGFAHKGRILWVVEATGRLEVYRFSDGRKQMQLELGGEILSVDGKLDSSRIVLAHKSLDPRQGVELIVIDLVQRERQQLPVEEGTRAFCVIEGASPSVALVGEGRVQFTPLQPLATPRPTTVTVPMGAAQRDEVPETPAWAAATTRFTERAAAAATTAAGATGEQDRTSSRLSAWRARLRTGATGATEGGIEVAAEGGAEGGLSVGVAEAPEPQAPPPDSLELQEHVESGAHAQPRPSTSQLLRERKPWQSSTRSPVAAAEAAPRTPPSRPAPSSGARPAPSSGARPAPSSGARPAPSSAAAGLAPSSAAARLAPSSLAARLAASGRPGSAAPVTPVARPTAQEPAARSLGALRPRTSMARTPTPAVRPPSTAPVVSQREPPFAPRDSSGLDDSTDDSPFVDDPTSPLPEDARDDASSGAALDERTGLDEPGAWREALTSWAEVALASKLDQDPPTIAPASSLGLMTVRYGLDAIAERLLALMYASWLLGHHEQGVSVATAARIIDDRDDWKESLGRAALGRAGLVENRRGRLRLRPSVGRLLDGLPPRASIVAPVADDTVEAREPADVVGHHLAQPLEGEGPAELAERLASELAQSVAFVDGRALSPARLHARVRDLVIEARLFNAIPLVWVDSEIGDGPWREQLEDAPLLLAALPVPSSLAHLPVWDRAEPRR